MAVSHGCFVNVQFSAAHSCQKLGNKGSFRNVLGEDHVQAIAMCQVSNPIRIPSVSDAGKQWQLCNGHASCFVADGVRRLSNGSG